MQGRLTWNKGSMLFVLVLLAHSLYAQNQAWVFFKDKGPITTEDIRAGFPAAGIERHDKQGIPFDERDADIPSSYLTALDCEASVVFGSTRWLNAAVVEATAEQFEKIEALAFVDHIEYMDPTTAWLAEEIDGVNHFTEEEKLHTAQDQTNHLEAYLFKENNIKGTNVKVAVFDAGFKKFKEEDALISLRRNKQIVEVFDFLKENQDIYGYTEHGKNVVSFIAGSFDSVSLGLAPNVELFLARVTPSSGYFHFLNEIYWIQALEWADKRGVEIVNSSLSFTHQMYKRNQLDGKTCKVSIAAATALDKGILVVNAAGNEYNNSWETIGAPADAEGVLCVGAVDAGKHYTHAYFSRIGPTMDYRTKPDVVALGMIYNSEDLTGSRLVGTSFASPLVAGFAACVRQMHPDWTAKKLLEEIRKSGHLYPYYDYAHGYGIPQASYFLSPSSLPQTDYCFLLEPSDSTRTSFQLDVFPANDTDSLSTNLCLEEFPIYYQWVRPDQSIKHYGVMMRNLESPYTTILEKGECDKCFLRVYFDHKLVELPADE